MSVYHKQGSDGSLETHSQADYDTQAGGGTIIVTANIDKEGWAAATTDRRLFTADRPYVVKAISCAPDTAEGGALTASFYKVSDHTATVGSGTILHAGSINLNTTAAARQNLTITAAAAALDEGDAVGIVLSAVAATAVAMISICLAPR